MSFDLIVGPMYSNKTSMLPVLAAKYAYNPTENKIDKILYFKSDIDTRYLGTSETNNKIISHTGKSNDAIVIKDGKEILNYEAKVYCIDEGHFISGLYAPIESLIYANRFVIVSMLTGTYKKTNFLNVVDLYSLATNIIHLKSTCRKCLMTHGIVREAPYSMKIKGKESDIEVGGDGMYCALCPDCYKKEDMRQKKFDDN
jgi:thymidine kinase